MNGYINGDGEDEELGNTSDGGSNSNGTLFPLGRDGRSVSSTLHDRARSTPASSVSPAGAIAKRSASKSRHHQGRSSLTGNPTSQPQPVGGSRTQAPPGAFGLGGGVGAPHHGHSGSTSSSPSTARETFLNYFFGQNGPGPIAGSSVERAAQQQHAHSQHSHHHSPATGVVPVGRDVSGTEPALNASLMAGKRGIDGNNAAYDMKSLGKHIEAVSLFSLLQSLKVPN